MQRSYLPIIDQRASCKLLKKNTSGAWETSETSFTDSIEQANAILVGGGDGFMIKTIKQFHHYQLPFVGINCGTLWFLLNQETDIQKLPQRKEDLTISTAHLIEVEITTKDGSIHKDIAINDVSIGNTIMDYIRMDIAAGKRSEKVEGTGMVIANAIGSTAYTLKLWVPLIPLESNLLCIAGIATNPFRYHFIQNETIHIDCKARTSIKCSCDGHSNVYDDVIHISIKLSEKTVQLGRFANEDFKNKRLLSAAQKLG